MPECFACHQEITDLNSAADTRKQPSYDYSTLFLHL